MKKVVFLIISYVSQLTVHAGIYEPKVLWHKPDVEVCFYDEESQLEDTVIYNNIISRLVYQMEPDEVPEEKKKSIEEVIVRNFTPETTGIHFTGWKKCSESEDANVVIIRARGVSLFNFRLPVFYKGMASIGEQSYHSEDQGFFQAGYRKKSFVLLPSLAPEVALHEFGHVAGLRHEHIHSDAKNDYRCKLVPAFQGDGILEKPDVSTIINTEYDKDSIMNYCYLVTHFLPLTSREANLSPLDKETLKSIY